MKVRDAGQRPEQLPFPPAGTNTDHFGTITRGDGKKQTTYTCMPLYYFAGDAKPGGTNGQGIKEVWYAAAP